jgi:uncharacterized protein (TIGR02145 family)
MKKLIFFFALATAFTGLYAQDITISFQPKVPGTPIDSIWVTNLKTNQKVKLLGNESLTLTKTTGVNVLSSPINRSYLYPNPCYGDAMVNLSASINQKVEIRVYNISGKLLNTKSQYLDFGNHKFSIKFPTRGIYGVSILSNEAPLSFKVVCIGGKEQGCSIFYSGNESFLQLKIALTGKFLSYTQGNILHYSVFSEKNNTIITDSLTANKIYQLEFSECIDKDNISYPIVKIGEQWWMAENLQTTKYNDGPAIPNVTNHTTWDALTSDAFCWYNNIATYRSTYGALYNWFAVNTGKLCPKGWHIPSITEWATLSDFLGGTLQAGAKLKETGITHWLSSNTGATNESGFSGLPGGTHNNSGFYYINSTGFYWSSTEYSATYARDYGMYANSVYFQQGIDRKQFGLSVRCVKD